MPLHPNQHAYQPGKSVESAFHQLVVRVGKELDQQETALGVFLDIEGAFNNTFYDSMCGVLDKHRVDYTIVRWIRTTLGGRLAMATLGGSTCGIEVSSDCPQRVVLSLLLWCLVVDDLIARLSGYGVYTQDTRTFVFYGWGNSRIR
jgi:Reverse transcriptase (RNA-dependent DNA polymerase).